MLSKFLKPPLHTAKKKVENHFCSRDTLTLLTAEKFAYTYSLPLKLSFSSKYPPRA